MRKGTSPRCSSGSGLASLADPGHSELVGVTLEDSPCEDGFPEVPWPTPLVIARDLDYSARRQRCPRQANCFQLPG